MPLDEEDSSSVDASAGMPVAPQSPSTTVDRLRSYTEAACGASALNTECAIRADTAIFTAWCLAAGDGGALHPAAGGQAERGGEAGGVAESHLKPATICSVSDE